MTREEMAARARRLVADWPPLTPEQRLRLAVVLRPDMPVGIQRPAVRKGTQDGG